MLFFPDITLPMTPYVVDGDTFYSDIGGRVTFTAEPGTVFTYVPREQDVNIETRQKIIVGNEDREIEPLLVPFDNDLYRIFFDDCNYVKDFDPRKNYKHDDRSKIQRPGSDNPADSVAVLKWKYLNLREGRGWEAMVEDSVLSDIADTLMNKYMPVYGGKWTDTTTPIYNYINAFQDSANVILTWLTDEQMDYQPAYWDVDYDTSTGFANLAILYINEIFNPLSSHQRDRDYVEAMLRQDVLNVVCLVEDTDDSLYNNEVDRFTLSEEYAAMYPFVTDYGWVQKDNRGILMGAEA